jgi:hypothetical protein
MTEVSRLESKYDAFLFASLGEDDELPLSVLSVLRGKTSIRGKRLIVWRGYQKSRQ